MAGSKDCPICSLGLREHSMATSIAPSALWLDTTRKINGVIVMEFGVGDGEEHIIYRPKYCPECGRKVHKDG